MSTRGGFDWHEKQRRIGRETDHSSFVSWEFTPWQFTPWPPHGMLFQRFLFLCVAQSLSQFSSLVQPSQYGANDSWKTCETWVAQFVHTKCVKHTFYIKSGIDTQILWKDKQKTSFAYTSYTFYVKSMCENSFPLRSYTFEWDFKQLPPPLRLLG